LYLGLGLGSLWALWDAPPHYIETWRDGAEGEERTADVLAALQSEGWHLAHDLEDAYGNIDQVLVGPPGVFLLDSKKWQGKISLENGIPVSRRPLSPRSSFRHHSLPRRMRGAAASLRRRLCDLTQIDERVTAVVVIWGDFSQRLAEDDQVVYLDGNDLTEWLRHRPQRLDVRTQNLFALAVESGLALSTRHTS
jgi:hypothetical protein